MAQRFTAKEHIAFPAELEALGLEDYSWSQDGAARAQKDLGGDRILVVWVAEENAQEREPGLPRYGAYTAIDTDDRVNETEERELYTGENLDELLAALREVK